MKRIAPDLAVVILTGYSSKDVAIEALKGKANDYIESLSTSRRRRRSSDFSSSAPARVPEMQGTVSKIARVKSFLERNCHKLVSLEEAAELVCLSPKYLSRLFKERTGQGFNEYRLHCKIDRSKELLRRPRPR